MPHPKWGLYSPLYHLSDFLFKFLPEVDAFINVPGLHNKELHWAG